MLDRTESHLLPGVDVFFQAEDRIRDTSVTGVQTCALPISRLREVRTGRPNVVAELGSDDGPTLVFNGHLDTVPVGEGWTMDPFGGDVRDGRVYGRGACDMLGGVAAMCTAAVALKRSGLPLTGRLVVHGVVDEEVDAIGSQLAAEEVEADWVVVTEPTGGKVYAFGKGQVNVEVTFTGRAAH